MEIFKIRRKRNSLLSNQQLIRCCCGCGLFLLKYDNKYRERKYINGHRNHLDDCKERAILLGKSRKGIPRPLNVKIKISIGHKGKKLSQFTKNKISKNVIESMKDPIIRKIISLANTGKIPWNKGKHIWKNKKHPKGMLGKTSTRKGKSYEQIYGTERTKEIKEKYMEKRVNQILPVKDTKPEVKIQNFLKQLGIEFFTHQYMHIEHGYQCDILIPSKNLVIECDGDYWHSYPTGTEIDHIRTSELIAKGFKVLRLWEFEINKMSINEFKWKIK